MRRDLLSDHVPSLATPSRISSPASLRGRSTRASWTEFVVAFAPAKLTALGYARAVPVLAWGVVIFLVVALRAIV